MLTLCQPDVQAMTITEMLARLKQYQLLPQFQQELIIDAAIAEIDCTPDEIAAAHQQLIAKYQLTSDAAKDQFCQQRGLTAEDLDALLTRLCRIEKFKQQTWGHKLESYFLQRKPTLDRVIYSILQVEDADLAQELYFRLQDDEQSFAELARHYAPETANSLVGPVELGAIHPDLAYLLSLSYPGQLWHPIPIGETLVILRLEQLLPARLDQAMRQRLLQELFDQWVGSGGEGWGVGSEGVRG
ncbi:peptidylprolyl isomerase [Leptolyngbya sp. NK1-12]|uniref:peptidylprolyl isomerase n=1 Tax=Leptolyngbya sp. NK1-12 TaxID=2547451 RepID=A0AA96WCQ5_9CYAN|nr:peptidylprolyl isomerase [Leptolyngbya sp. NK1-12]WNZ22540.1 peptidylprolyl isomerase [Leptolyngbya sp. NK1-12]